MKAAIIKAARRGLEWMRARLAAEAGLHPQIVACWEYWEQMPGERPGAPAKMQEALARAGAALEGDVVRLSMAAGR